MNNRLLLICALFSCLSFSCKEETSDDVVIGNAKSFFEENCTVLSLPCFHGDLKTKSSEYLTSLSPVWEKARVLYVGEGALVEVPLTGTAKLGASIVCFCDRKESVFRGTSQSYLLVDQRRLPQATVSVETFIQKGNSCSMSYGSDKTTITGFQVSSNTDGTVRTVRAFHNGHIYEASNEDHHCRCHDTNKSKYDIIGVSFVYQVLSDTKGGNCPGHATLICTNCGRTFYPSINDFDFVCPYCGDKGSYDPYYFQYCPTCGKQWNQCACQNPAGSCPPCGRNEVNCGPACTSPANSYCICE